MFADFVVELRRLHRRRRIFVAMMGVGVAEGAGLMGALIRKLVKMAPAGLLTFIIVFVGCLSSVATDAGYLILIPWAPPHSSASGVIRWWAWRRPMPVSARLSP